MQTRKSISVMGWGKRQTAKALIYAVMVATVIGLSGCLWCPWPFGPGGGPRGGGGGPGMGGGGPRGGGGGPGMGGGGPGPGPEMRR
jgi:hypothetical protein